MDREQAIKIIKDCKKKCFKRTYYTVSEYEEAVDMAIKALEQEPCEDAISRQAVMDLLQNETEEVYITSKGRTKISIAEIDVEDLESLPSVSVAEKTGRWIPVSQMLPEDGIYLVTVERTTGKPRIETKSYAKDLNRVDDYDFPEHKCGWYDYDSEYGYWEDTNVIAWMPLPQPYEPQESEVQNADSNRYT